MEVDSRNTGGADPQCCRFAGLPQNLGTHSTAHVEDVPGNVSHGAFLVAQLHEKPGVLSYNLERSIASRREVNTH